MGMFDSFYFKDGILPNNKAPEGFEFQTKDLDCMLDKYYVDECGNVNKYTMRNEEYVEENVIITDTVYIYSLDFIYDKPNDYSNKNYLGHYRQNYKIIIINNKIMKAEKIEGYYENKEGERTYELLRLY